MCCPEDVSESEACLWHEWNKQLILKRQIHSVWVCALTWSRMHSTRELVNDWSNRILLTLIHCFSTLYVCAYTYNSRFPFFYFYLANISQRKNNKRLLYVVFLIITPVSKDSSVGYWMLKWKIQSMLFSLEYRITCPRNGRESVVTKCYRRIERVFINFRGEQGRRSNE